MLATYTWNELIKMHKFYMFGPPANKCCQDLLELIEHELVERACRDADKTLHAEIPNPPAHELKH